MPHSDEKLIEKSVGKLFSGENNILNVELSLG